MHCGWGLHRGKQPVRVAMDTRAMTTLCWRKDAVCVLLGVSRARSYIRTSQLLTVFVYKQHVVHVSLAAFRCCAQLWTSTCQSSWLMTFRCFLELYLICFLALCYQKLTILSSWKQLKMPAKKTIFRMSNFSTTRSFRCSR